MHMLEVFVDDFIQLAQTTDEKALRHCSRAVLHGIHSVFPPPNITGHNGEDPVPKKKDPERGRGVGHQKGGTGLGNGWCHHVH